MDPINQTGSGSKKGLYIAIGIVVILILGYMMRGSFGMRGPNGVNVNNHIDGSTTYSSEYGSVTTGGNKPPENWPSDVPMYSNAKIEQSISANPQTGTSGSTVIFTTNDSVQGVIDFYKKGLSTNSWTTVGQTATVGANTILTAKKDQRFVSVMVTDIGGGKSRVTVSAGTVPSVKFTQTQ